MKPFYELLSDIEKIAAEERFGPPVYITYLGNTGAKRWSHETLKMKLEEMLVLDKKQLALYLTDESKALREAASIILKERNAPTS